MRDEHAHDADTDETQHRRRWMIATTIVAVFMVALFVGMWVGGDAFGS